MKFKFNKNSLKEWANFSSDYNPIHFEELKARLIGLDNLAVHGMLAMLPLKQHTTSLFMKQQQEGYVWYSSLRAPLDVDKEYQLSLKNTDSKLSFALQDINLTKKYFIGRVQKNRFEKTMQNYDFSETQKFNISFALMKQKLQEFQTIFPRISLLWIYFDALIFSLFISKHATPLCTGKFKSFMEGQEQFIGDKVMFLHTNHQVFVSPHISHQNLEKLPETVEYDVIINETTFHEESLLISFVIPVWIMNEISLIITMNIMGIKTNS
ncbi:hypothetical protein J3U11_03320 [Gilliamella sp. B2840]|uniref:MaoC/PaaZ C-terminal domain-containing protein n=1 Tax=Gilliamella sp. B2840 TaxID=2817975 RepID=UPI00226A9676|nr:MaoC/PaaZ C-terminal domain-containing protein [Gilliamella sp. B2840]MCX8700098.1 hypothetical protein [Gilliamella sp. B2840]